MRPDRRDLVLSLAIALLTAAALGGVIGNGFVDLDDSERVARNELVLAGWTGPGFAYAWTTFDGGNWTPLAILSLMTDAALLGPRPAGFHLVNLLLHVANAVLFFWLLRIATNAPLHSAAAAALWGVHPLHVESVAWIAERRDVLFLLWTLISLLLYLRYVARPGRGRYATFGVAFVSALLSKPMAVTVPLLMLCLDFWPLERDANLPAVRRWCALILEKLPLLAASLAVGVVTMIAQRGAGATSALGPVSLAARLGNAISAGAWYVEKTFWPTQLCVMYHHPGAAQSLPRLARAASVLLAITIWVAFGFRRRPWLLTGWAWFAIALLPVIGLLQVGIQAYADRYVYLPHLGLLLMIVWEAAFWLRSLSAPQWLAPGLLTFALLAFSARCWQQVACWKDPPALWRQALAVDPENSFVQLKSGYWQMRSGQWADALQHFERATTIDPNYADAWVNQGCIWESQNNWNLARRCYERALQIDPRHSFALCNLGTVCQKTGRLEQAVEFLRRGVEIANPGDWELRHQLGLVYAQQENMPAAARWFQDAARINPQAAGVLNNLGLALWRLGRVDDARQKLEAAIAASPDFAQAHANLGMVYELLGRTADAKVHYAETLRLNPADQEIRVRLEKLQSPQ